MILKFVNVVVDGVADQLYRHFVHHYSIVCTPISKMAASEPAVYSTDPPRQERFEIWRRANDEIQPGDARIVQ